MRHDLTYLRRRSRPVAAQHAAPAPVAVAPAGAQASQAFASHDILSLDSPSTDSPSTDSPSTDAASGPPSANAPSFVAPTSNPLDLFAPAETVAPLVTGAASEKNNRPRLNLRANHTPLPQELASIPGIAAGQRIIMDDDNPVIALNRVQSGIGHLTLRIDTPAGPNLRIGVIASDPSGQERVLHSEHLPQFAGLSLSANGRVLLDQRKIRTLSRALLFVRAYSPETMWDGVGYLTTSSEIRAEVPLRYPEPHETMAMVSLFIVAGQIVIRAENDHVDRPLRVLAGAYGFDDITWRDDRTPFY